MLFIIDKSKDLFYDEKLKINPYKLLYCVIKFAVKHKKPIKRSAFTYCDKEIPSRIDYGKQRYGGPFTTEQVEDVKVLLRIVLVLVTLGPVFLLDSNINIMLEFYIRGHRNKHDISIKTEHNLSIFMPLVVVLSLPFIHFIVKPIFNRVTIGMFKRMGLSIIVTIGIFIIWSIVNIIGYAPLFSNSDYCFKLNYSLVLDKHLVHIPVVVTPIIVQILYGLYTILIKISVLEFISCQTPQHMKGIVFGIWYFIQSVFLLLSAIISYIFYAHFNVLLDSPQLNCAFIYYMVNIIIGVGCLIIFTVASRRYKYRKRDDICNVYQYAENYYSDYS